MMSFLVLIIQALAPNLKGCCVVNGLVPRTLFMSKIILGFFMFFVKLKINSHNCNLQMQKLKLKESVHFILLLDLCC